MVHYCPSLDNTDDQPSEPIDVLVDVEDTLYNRSIPIEVLEDALYCQDVNGLNATCDFPADNIPSPEYYLESGQPACKNVVIRVCMYISWLEKI